MKKRDMIRIALIPQHGERGLPVCNMPIKAGRKVSVTFPTALPKQQECKRRINDTNYNKEYQRIYDH